MKIDALISCLCLLLLTTTAIAGDSTSVAPSGVTKRSHTYTHGDNVYTSGGNVYAGGGDLRQVRLIKTNRIYAQGSGSWINVYDHFDMNNRVIYDVNRIRVNDYTPSHHTDLASKWYVDKNSGKTSVKSGTGRWGWVIYPISGYSRSQCTISLSGVPYKYSDGAYKRSRHYSLWYEHAGSGWRLRAGHRYIADNGIRHVKNAYIQYAVVCAK
ncbi:MAG: hypothetical protein R6V39_05710 [Desulfovibrionales bacterium]